MMYGAGLPQGQSLGPHERSEYTLYGAAGISPYARRHLKKKAPVDLNTKRPLRMDCVLICLLTPICQFAVVTTSLSFSFHSFYPTIAWIIVLACGIFTLACCYLAVKTVMNFWNGDLGRRPFWYIFLAFTMIIAFFFSVFLGMMNWYDNEVPERLLRDLGTATRVNVSNSTGKQFMDVGSLSFLNNTWVDTGKAMYFVNDQVFCVAPIVYGNGTQSYDFWSVGIDCCGKKKFQCGEYKNPLAHSGLRMVRQDQREFYLLAVQQAEAAYHIRSKNPLFFYWLQDPIGEMDQYQKLSKRHAGFGLLAFSSLQVMLVVLSMVAYTRM